MSSRAFSWRGLLRSERFRQRGQDGARHDKIGGGNGKSAERKCPADAREQRVQRKRSICLYRCARTLMAHYRKRVLARLAAGHCETAGLRRATDADLDLLMVATGAMASPDQYMNAGELALAAGCPAPRRRFSTRMRDGQSRQGGQADRPQRLVAMAKRQMEQRHEGPRAASRRGRRREQRPALGEARRSLCQLRAIDDAVAAFTRRSRKAASNAPRTPSSISASPTCRRVDARQPKPLLNSVAGANGIQDLARL